MLPSPRFYNPAGDTEQTTHDFGDCDAGSYKPDASGWEVWIWNDKGGSLGSDDMTSARISIRDIDGGEDEVWTKQHWVEIKSYGVSSPSDTFIDTDVDTGTEIITIGIDIATGKKIRFTTTDTLPAPLAAGTTYFAIRVDATHIKVATTLANAIALTAINLTTQGAGTHTVTVYIADDAMAAFQSVGLNKELSLGDIPSNCARKLFVRVYPPTDAEEQNVSAQLKITYLKPSASIMKWLTGLFGNGVVNMGNKLEVTDNVGADSVIDIADGYALIDDAEIYFGSIQTHTISTDAGTYKIYLTHTGTIGSTTSSIPSNSILLAWVTIAGSVVTAVVDKRGFVPKLSFSGGLLSIAVVSFAADADTILYTVPTGRRCVLTHAIIVAAGDAGATTTVSIGADGTETDFVPANTLSNLDAEYDSVILIPIPNTTPLKIKSYAADTVIEARVASQSGVAGNTIYLFGILY